VRVTIDSRVFVRWSCQTVGGRWRGDTVREIPPLPSVFLLVDELCSLTNSARRERAVRRRIPPPHVVLAARGHGRDTAEVW
jgi:hypothetical protein